MEPETLDKKHEEPMLPHYFFVLRVRENYAHTCCKCFSLMKGLELLCCYDIFRSIQVCLILIALGIVGRTQEDARTFFRVLQVLYGVPATWALYGLEKLLWRWLLYYYYVKLFEVLSTIIKNIILLAAGYCSDASILNYFEGFCFTGLDVVYMLIELLALLYQTYILFSFLNLVSTGRLELAGLIVSTPKNSIPTSDNAEVPHDPLPLPVH